MIPADCAQVLVNSVYAVPARRSALDASSNSVAAVGSEAAMVSSWTGSLPLTGMKLTATRSVSNWSPDMVSSCCY